MDNNGKRRIILVPMITFAPRRRRVIALAIAAFASGAIPARSGFAHEPDADEIALGSLIDAELAFARMSLERGIRAAFLANFAPDGIVFEPAPVRLHETWPARPPPADPRALRLEWQPAQAGVAHAGDLGYTTGPFTLTDTTQPGRVRHGVFFSVWQRNAAEVWRVVLDIGIQTVQPFDFVGIGAAPRPRFVGRADLAAQRKTLFDREARPIAAERAKTFAAAYAGLLGPDARLHRDGMPPIAGRAAIGRHIAAAAARITWSPVDVRVAGSADMAVSYGSFRESDHGGQGREGYYAHLWLRDTAGRWRLAYDIALASS
jgi:ketosteroid isomerase-like protein